MPTTATVDATAAQQAVATAGERVVRLLREIGQPEAPALGPWNVTDVAVHLSHVIDAVSGMAKGGGGILADIWRLGELTGALVQGESEREPGDLADRVEASIAAFLTYARDAGEDDPRTWFVPGTTLRLSGLTCHVLNDLLVHGRDIAVAEGVPWPIPRQEAGLVLNGFLFPVMAALGRSLVDRSAAAGVRATFDIRVRGGGRAVFRFDDGDLSVHQGAPHDPVDCHLSVDPVAFLLVAWGRINQYSAIARGQLLAWGRKPWLGLKLRELVRNP